MSSKSKKVSFGGHDANSKSSHYDRDSGVGSSSTERASSGGRPDRKATNEQRRSPFALQEALNNALESVKDYREKALDLNLELASSNKARRDSEARWRAACDEIAVLKDDNESLRRTLKQCQNELIETREGLRHQYYTEPISPMISGGLSRSKSQRNSSEEQKDRMKGLIKPLTEAESSGKRSHKSSHSPGNSVSQTSSSYRGAYGAYIEKQPGTPRYYQPQVSSSRMVPTNHPTNTWHDTPRSYIPPSFSTDGYQEVSESGNYFPHPLPERSHRKK